MIKKFSRRRRIAGLVLLLVLLFLPFLHINGESAVRFDVPTLRFLLFGAEIGMADSFILLIALFFFTFFVLFATSLLGRLWCGWICPQTILIDATDFARGLVRLGALSRPAAGLLVFIICTVIAAGLVGYFVPPPQLPVIIRQENPAAKIILGSWISLTVLLWLDAAFLQRTFCATVCPYARLQSVLFDDRTLQVAFDTQRAGECMDCRSCVKACPVGIDIRKGAQMECIHCAECADACTERMAARNKRSLIGYFFGQPGRRQSGLRVNIMITGSAALLALLYLLFLTTSKLPFDFTVRLDYSAELRQQSDGTVANRYELSVRNVSSKDLPLELTAFSGAGIATISPASITVGKNNEVTRIPATVTLKGAPVQAKDQLITITVRSPGDGKSLDRQVYFLLPAQR